MSTMGPQHRRLVVSLGGSAILHALLLLALAFDVAGIGGGFGLGVGWGFGMGAGGGVGLGEKRERQIFSIEDLPEYVRPDDEEQLTRLLQPEQRQAIEIPRTERPVTTKGPIVSFKRPVRPESAGADLARRFTAAGSGTGGFGGGGGGGFGFSLGSAFGKYVTTLRRVGLDVVLVVDATGSMQNIIDELKQRLGALVGTMQRLVPTARIGAVAFRDRDDDNVATAPRKSEDFLVRWTDLTFSGKKVQGFLSSIVAEGGGDWEEAVLAGLTTAMKQLKWRQDAKKVIILVGSSPPHAADVPAIRTLVTSWHAQGGVINTIDVSERLHEEHERKLNRWLYGEEPKEISPLPDFYKQLQQSFGEIAHDGGGTSVRIDQDDLLVRQLLVLAFGKQWEKEVAHVGRAM
jgi:von Willebrand factor type A domain-containing protein